MMIKWLNMTFLDYFCNEFYVNRPMAKKKNTKVSKNSFVEVTGLKNLFQNDIFNFIMGIILILMSVYIVISFISFFNTGSNDQSLILDLRQGEILNKEHVFQNSCGSYGAFVAYYFISRCFGFSAFIIPAFMFIMGLDLVKAYRINLWKCFFCMSIVMIWLSVMSAKMLTPILGSMIFNPGGDSGLYCCQWLENIVGTPGLLAILLLTALLFLTYLSRETIIVVRKLLNPVHTINDMRFRVLSANDNKSVAQSDNLHTAPMETLDDPKVFDNPSTQKVEFSVENAEDATVIETPTGNAEPIQQPINANVPTGSEPNTATPVQEMQIHAGMEEEVANSNTVQGEVDLNVPINPKEPWTRYKYPTLDLLKKYENDGKPYIDMKEQTANKNRIVEVLNNFGVQIKTISATVGPTITLYEITPAEGVRISKIRNLEDDIALSLAALGIRIIAPIPGKGTIGIEVPNAKQNIVSMESILNSKKFQETKMELPIAIGKTITNEVYMVDLAKLPHLLVAGATGQGKSVGLNAIITSLLYKKHPNELKFVLIDPKKVEFSIYAPIVPHFMAKVEDNDEAIITDVKKVIRTLNSLCKLMDNRYDMLKLAGAKNIVEYNRKYVNHQLRLTDGHEFMPYIVVIIDEFGDLIMTAGKEIEMPIARIAQLARAVGIHMVIATQRPTTSIITGNIKANFPARMAFRVSAMIDSRTILDRPGANQLIGKGDLLFLEKNEPVRVQCAFVDTPEIENISRYIASQPGPLEPMELPEPATDDDDSNGGGSGIDAHNLDPLFEEAARSIVLSQQGSTSMIQRKFSIGYNRAGRLMDQMEKAGIVGQAHGSKPREVLIQDESSLESLLSQIKH